MPSRHLVPALRGCMMMLQRKGERRLHAQSSSKRDAGMHHHQPTKTLPKDFQTSR